MTDTRIDAGTIELRPLTPSVAAALLHDRPRAERLLGAAVPPSWPQPDLLDILPMLASAKGSAGRFGAWVMVEREVNSVVGDIGFLGPPVDGVVEIGFSVIPERRRLGYASAAASALVEWALRQPDVQTVTARSDAGNIGSARVLAHAGLSRAGEASSQITWSSEAPASADDAG